MNRPNAKRVIKLPALPSHPIESDLTRAMNEAQSQKGCSVQLNWIDDAKQVSYTLSCAISDTGGVEWILTSGFGMHANVVWSQYTGDVELINNLILFECGEVAPPTQGTKSLADLGELVRAESQERAARTSYAAPTPAPTPTPSTPSAPRTATVELDRTKNNNANSLQGNLKELAVSGLLQSIAMNRMTGQLVVREDLSSILIYFDDGMPIHALAPESEGEQAILDLLTWDAGTFHFAPNERTADRTIVRRLEGILMEGAALVDQNQFLVRRGIKLGAYLLRKNPNLTERQFEEALVNGVPIDINIQKYIYQLVDNRRNLADILRIRPMLKAEWVPIMYNLIACNIVELSERPTLAAKQSALEAVGVDPAAVVIARKSLVRPESGLLSFPLFLLFLEQEFQRYELSSTPFSLLLFEIAVKKDKGFEPISGRELLVMANLVDQVKRQIDWLGHFRTLEFGLILPATDTAGAIIIANRILEVIRNSTMGGASNPEDFQISVGLASIPHDAQNLGQLLSSTVEAKKTAKDTQAGVVAFRSLFKA